MNDNEQIRAIFVNGVANITRSTRVANLVHAKIILWKRYLCLLSIVFWTIILYILFS